MTRTVLRSDLIRRIRAADSARIITVVAPAGYGKSTLLSQLADHAPVPSASITLRAHHNDPALLLRDIADGLVEAEILADDVGNRLEFTSATALTTGVWRLTKELRACHACLLLLDQFEAVRTTAGKDTLTELLMAMPPSITVAIGSRTDVPATIPTVRTQGELLELSTFDAAMSLDEAREMAELMRVPLGEEELESIVRHTEGWAAGLYLTFLRVRSGFSPTPVAEIGGTDRFIAQYLRTEVLGKLTPARREFLLQTSILDELSSQVCDFVLDRTGSDRVLQTLEASSRFVVSVDRVGHRYRYHQMLREVLVADIERSDPDLVVRLRLRSAEWYEQNRLPIDAVNHAIEANSADLTARLVTTWSFKVFSDGNVDTVLEWISWFDRKDQLDEHPEIALLGALASAEIGDHIAVDRWIAVVDRTDDLGSIAPVAHLANALFGRNGVQQSLIDARAAQAELTPSSDWYAPAVALEAQALLCSGQTDSATQRLELAFEAADRFSAPTAALFSIATLSMLASEQGDFTRADDLSALALNRARKAIPRQYASTVLPFAVAARSALRRGDPEEARSLLGQAHAGRTMLSRATPVISVQTLVEMAGVHIELADFAGARRLLRDVGAIVRVRSVGLLEDRWRQLRDTLDQMPAGQVGPATLTNAELRLLPLLTTHLSFPEIGERLYISRHTVKSEAMSIYRKLGASSRSEAVERAREMRILNN